MATTDLIACYFLIFAFIFIVIPGLAWCAVGAIRDAKCRDEDNAVYETKNIEASEDASKIGRMSTKRSTALGR